jgi:hypothetical protein
VPKYRVTVTAEVYNAIYGTFTIDVPDSDTDGLDLLKQLLAERKLTAAQQSRALDAHERLIDPCVDALNSPSPLAAQMLGIELTQDNEIDHDNDEWGPWKLLGVEEVD